MGVKLEADEIISIIKERIDDFEINVDVSIPTQERGIEIVGACAKNKLLSIVKEMINEQLIFYNALTNQEEETKELIKALDFKYPILKEEKSKDWYRKFDNKKRWQK